MNTYKHAIMASAIVLGTFACAPGEDEIAEDRPIGAPSVPPPSVPTSSEFAEFRGEVRETFDEIRAELATMRDSVRAESADAWEDLSGSAERVSDEVMANLERLGEATVDEARRIRRSTGERLAELEGEVARRDVATAPDQAAMIDAMNERLAELEADLDAIWNETVTVVDTLRPPPGTATDQSMVTVSGIMDLRERLVELRAELSRFTAATDEEFVAARENLGEEVAELTRDVRREYYEARWGLDTV